MIGIDKLFEHMDRFHPDSPYWGDSGNMVNVHKCFLCGLNLIKSTVQYKTIKEQEEEIVNVYKLKVEPTIIRRKNVHEMTAMEWILHEISEATEPGKLTTEEALVFLEDLSSWIDRFIDALKVDINND